MDQQLQKDKLKCQKQEIEIERLQITCRALNYRASQVEDLQAELEVLNRRLFESETLAAMKDEECKLVDRQKKE